jgi:pyruvate,water dikinase
VWGDIFTIVLGDRARGLNFTETATLHLHRAYFNATLLGEIFRRMGLPAESLEFLTRGEKFTKPPLLSTLRNLPGLLRLLDREKNLAQDFAQDERRYFTPTLGQIEAQPPSQLPPEALLERIDTILTVLKKATYYSILVPLSLALRQAIFQVSPEQLDNSQTPEVKSLRSLAHLAIDARNLLPMDRLNSDSCASLFAHLAEIPDGENILAQFDQWLENYGYLSEVATDIAVPCWQENPHPVRELFTQYLLREGREHQTPVTPSKPQSWPIKQVQGRLDLKGKSTTVYSQLLAHLRWSFLALAQKWQQSGVLSEAEDIFFLKLGEIRRLIAGNDPQLREQIAQLVQQRRWQLERSQGLAAVPPVVYGNPSISEVIPLDSSLPSLPKLQGIAASPGQVEGRVKILHNLQGMAEIDAQTIIVVPYTDSGWAPLLAHAGGLIAEVGGQLSHGAIVAREYGIPAVMDVHNATQLLRDGQRVRIDGQEGVVEILAD